MSTFVDHGVNLLTLAGEHPGTGRFGHQDLDRPGHQHRVELERDPATRRMLFIFSCNRIHVARFEPRGVSEARLPQVVRDWLEDVVAQHEALADAASYVTPHNPRDFDVATRTPARQRDERLANPNALPTPEQVLDAADEQFPPADAEHETYILVRLRTTAHPGHREKVARDHALTVSRLLHYAVGQALSNVYVHGPDLPAPTLSEWQPVSYDPASEHGRVEIGGAGEHQGA